MQPRAMLQVVSCEFSWLVSFGPSSMQQQKENNQNLKINNETGPETETSAENTTIFCSEMVARSGTCQAKPFNKLRDSGVVISTPGVD